ncbi:MAG: hypothetical protein RIA69_19385 [Cyclobacteriaceae bacterium]
MRIFLSSFIIFLLISFPLLARQSVDQFTSPDDVDSVTYQNDDVFIKFDFASLSLENLLFSAEYFIKPSRVSMSVDVGFLFSSKYIEDDSRSFFGYLLRPQLRYYYRPSTKRNQRWYTGLSARYKFGQSSGNLAIGEGCEGGDCDLYRQYTANATFHRIDMQINHGIQLRVYDDFYLEADLGLGYGYEFQNLPDGARVIDPVIHMNADRVGWGINGGVAARLIFVIDGKDKRE